MSEDILDRLKDGVPMRLPANDFVARVDYDQCDELLREAADEIERLRRAIAKAEEIAAESTRRLADEFWHHDWLEERGRKSAAQEIMSAANPSGEKEREG